ncbi:hypothetical protein [Brevibacillus laterosporus]|uniref:hypothetical protein n=1 Tax=Brevibacillus laterosporus TaxID=1465 RepID=UPI00215C4CA0|nr:hypothetical protein [Brevibacillus laterosporus]MCR8994627.1 hypothetical protein [Brevibacillus laterosporus]
MDIKATKANLSKLINWSSSRYNEKKKSDVLNEILFAIEVGEDVELTYGTGSYSERGHLGGWNYILKIDNEAITLTERKNVHTVYSLIKPMKNKLYTGAKKLRLKEARYDWHINIVGKEIEVVGETWRDFNLEYDGRIMQIDKKLVEIIER